MCKQHRPLSPNKAAHNYAPRVFGAMPKDKRESFRTKDFHDAMERLLSGPLPAIVVDEYGRPAARHLRLIRAPAPC
jgi:hypothetical protein